MGEQNFEDIILVELLAARLGVILFYHENVYNTEYLRDIFDKYLLDDFQ